MQSRALHRILTLSAVLLSLAACSSEERKVDVVTGWLGPLPNFERVSGSGPQGAFVRPTEAKAPALDAVFLRPVEITVGPGTNFNAPGPEDFEEMRGALTLILRKELEGVVRLTDTRGPGTYELRIALTDLKIDLADRRSLTPSRTDYRFVFSEVALEAELIEGATNFRRAVAIAPARDRARRAAEAPKDRWTDLPRRFVALAETLRGEIATLKQALAALRQLPPKPPAAAADAEKKPAAKEPAPAEKPKG
jgi:hypothetical protein